MERIFLDIYPAPPLIERGSILINEFGTGLGFFLNLGRVRDEFEYWPAPSRPNYI